MKTYTVVLATALALTGCAHRGKRVATAIVASTDVLADSFASEWSAATGAQIEKCRELELETVEKRKACLGPFTPTNTQKAIAAVQVLVTAQKAVKAAAECSELKTCLDDPDWVELGTQVQAAWVDLKPFVQAVKEKQ